MKDIKAWRLWRKLPKNNQKGFTLIELLVVISILGILAAIVTMSMIGITAAATQHAKDTEAKSVQVAWDTMLADQGVPADHECDGANGSSNDMTAGGLETNVYQPTNSLHVPVALSPHYLRDATTHGTYHCDTKSKGTLVRDTYSP